MKTAWLSPDNQTVHEMTPKQYSSAYDWSYCGLYFSDGQIHRAAKTVTCLWCVAKKER